MDPIKQITEDTRIHLQDRKRAVLDVVGAGADTKTGCLRAHRSARHQRIVKATEEAVLLHVEEEVPVRVVDTPPIAWKQMLEAAVRSEWPGQTLEEVASQYGTAEPERRAAVVKSIVRGLRQAVREVVEAERIELGVYVMRVAANESTDASSQDPEIRVKWLSIALAAEVLAEDEHGITIGDVTAVALAHYWGRALTQLGRNGRGKAYRGWAFEYGDLDVVQGLAHYMAWYASCASPLSRHRGAERAFFALERHLPPSWLGYRPFLDFASPNGRRLLSLFLTYPSMRIGSHPKSGFPWRLRFSPAPWWRSTALDMRSFLQQLEEVARDFSNVEDWRPGRFRLEKLLSLSRTPALVWFVPDLAALVSEVTFRRPAQALPNATEILRWCYTLGSRGWNLNEEWQVYLTEKNWTLVEAFEYVCDEAVERLSGAPGMLVAIQDRVSPGMQHRCEAAIHDLKGEIEL